MAETRGELADEGGRGRSGRRRRVAAFTHDAFGLGHVQRTTRILNEVARRAPDAAMLLITGSPSTRISRMLPPGADVLKLPTIKTSGGSGGPPTLPLGLTQLAALRGEICRVTLAAFDPDVLLVDNFPLGARHELLPALSEMRRRRTPTALGLRDVVDPPEKVRRDWARQGLHEVLEDLYDRILVYGDPSVLDPVEAYGLSEAAAAKLEHVGWVTGRAAALRAAEEVRRELDLPEGFVLATVGGGGDGRPLLETTCAAMATREALTARTILLVTGELMSDDDRDAVRAAARALPDARVVDFASDLPSLMAAAAAVVSMGGYNTTGELLATGARAVVVPRSWRSGEHADKGRTGVDREQLLRARGLAKAGAVEMVEPEALAAETLAEAIERALGRERAKQSPIPLDGASRAAAVLLSLMES